MTAAFNSPRVLSLALENCLKWPIRVQQSDRQTIKYETPLWSGNRRICKTQKLCHEMELAIHEKNNSWYENQSGSRQVLLMTATLGWVHKDRATHGSHYGGASRIQRQQDDQQSHGQRSRCNSISASLQLHFNFTSASQTTFCFQLQNCSNFTA